MKVPRLSVLLLTLLVAAACSFAAAAPGPVFLLGGNSMKGALFADGLRPALREHFQGRTRVALVLEALHPEDRRAMEARLQVAFRDLGAEAAALDLTDPAAARERLGASDGIFIVGGETFVLLAALHRHGLLEVVRSRVRAGMPYAGSSAGANVAGALIGTTNDFPVADIPSRVALGLVPVSVNPHHPLPASDEFRVRAAKIRTYLRFNPAETVLGIADTSMVRWQDGRLTLIAGAGWIYRAGGERELPLGQAVTDPGK